MQDLAAVAKTLQDSAGTLKSLGWMGVVFAVLIIAFLLLKPVLNRAPRVAVPSGQSISMTLPVPSNGNGGASGTPKPCPLHSGVEVTLTQLQADRLDNKSEHEKIFSKLDVLGETMIKSAAAASSAAHAAAVAAEAAANATYSRTPRAKARA